MIDARHYYSKLIYFQVLIVQSVIMHFYYARKKNRQISYGFWKMNNFIWNEKKDRLTIVWFDKYFNISRNENNLKTITHTGKKVWALQQ